MDRDGMLAYLGSTAFQEAAAAALRGAGPRPFVTISRQTGAGGADLARVLVHEMGRRRDEALFQGWRVFDRELCELVASDPKLTVVFDALTREAFRGEFADFIARFITDSSPQTQVVHRMFQVMRAAAGAGKAVIVGRGGSCLTRRLPLGVHIRLVASKAYRLARLRRLHGLGLAEAERRLEERDAARALLVKRHFLRDIDDPLLYDAVWNVETVAPPSIAAAVIGLVKERCAERLALPEAAPAG